MMFKVNNRGVPAGTGEFHVFNIECTLTLAHQHQIIKAGIRVRGVSDYTEVQDEKVTY